MDADCVLFEVELNFLRSSYNSQWLKVTSDILLRSITWSQGEVNWIGHILRRNCRVTQVIEGKIEERIPVTERRVRRRKQLLDDLKETKGYGKL